MSYDDPCDWPGELEIILDAGRMVPHALHWDGGHYDGREVVPYWMLESLTDKGFLQHIPPCETTSGISSTHAYTLTPAGRILHKRLVSFLDSFYGEHCAPPRSMNLDLRSLQIAPKELIFRQATSSDASDIARILVSFYKITDIREGQETFSKESAKGHTYIVAQKPEGIVGLVTWVMHGLPKHGLCELDRIAILPEHRGEKIGTRLVAALISDAAIAFIQAGGSLRKLYLLTHESNTDAHTFYEAMGFRHETTLKDHYHKGEDERVYSRFFKWKAA